MKSVQPSYQRSSVLDVCRGLAIILVVYGHAVEVSFFGKEFVPVFGFSQWQAIYSFHMAVFFVLSGFLHKRKDFLSAVKASLSLVFLAMLTHLVGAMFLPGVSLRSVIVPLYTLQYFSLTVTWYLVAHAWVILIAQFFTRASLLWRGAFAALLVVLFFATQGRLGRYFQLHTIPVGALFYGIGVIAARVWPSLSQRVPATAVLFALVCAGFACVAALAPMNEGCSFELAKQCRNHRGGFIVMFVLGNYGYIPMFFVSACVGVAAFFGLARVVDDVAPIWLRSWICRVGRNTVSLLIINGFFLVIVQPKIGRALDIGVLPSETVAWAAGLTAIQLLILPVLQPYIVRLVAVCDGASSALIGLLRLGKANSAVKPLT